MKRHASAERQATEARVLRKGLAERKAQDERDAAAQVKAPMPGAKESGTSKHHKESEGKELHHK